MQGNRPWDKPDSTCSGPDDGYSTERGGAGDCGSSKTESGSKLPRSSTETAHFISSSTPRTIACDPTELMAPDIHHQECDNLTL